jgi:hypothetical protein
MQPFARALAAADAAAVLMFSTRVGGHRGQSDGLLVARADGSDRISELTVFLRPLAALAALAEDMGRRLGGPRLAGPRPDGLA